MTENETLKIAVHCLGVQAEQEVCEECPVYRESGIVCKEIARTAISTLKEIQQYRQIGTVEEVEQNARDLKRQIEHSEHLAEVLKATQNLLEKREKLLKEYCEIGNVEECRAAVGKQKPKKPVLRNDNGKIRKSCPACGCFFSPLSRNCPKCGQALKMEKEDD